MTCLIPMINNFDQIGHLMSVNKPSRKLGE
jgi:hypothetical protein